MSPIPRIVLSLEMNTVHVIYGWTNVIHFYILPQWHCFISSYSSVNVMLGSFREDARAKETLQSRRTQFASRRSKELLRKLPKQLSILVNHLSGIIKPASRRIGGKDRLATWFAIHASFMRFRSSSVLCSSVQQRWYRQNTCFMTTCRQPIDTCVHAILY